MAAITTTGTATPTAIATTLTLLPESWEIVTFTPPPLPPGEIGGDVGGTPGIGGVVVGVGVLGGVVGDGVGGGGRGTVEMLKL